MTADVVQPYSPWVPGSLGPWLRSGHGGARGHTALGKWQVGKELGQPVDVLPWKAGENGKLLGRHTSKNPDPRCSDHF